MRAMLGSRAVLEVKGPDAAPFLHSVVTQSTTDRPTGAVAFGALLSPQGKIIADFMMTRTPEGFLLDAERAAAATLLKKLSVYKLRAAVDIAERPDLVVGAAWNEEARAEEATDPRSPALGRR
ncbi:MAG: folate-binding protein, partial [Parvularculaceae bacterium]|nr:folate-binding protein [Parvularculaceae bacterium]